jgi:2-polyprenyl-6-methoxyphenol hydroxylase-like FAD-dependent oxidoreductase
MDTQTTKTKTNVVIVGAGPTGLSLAAQLLRYNIDFVIIEENEKPTHLSKAIVIQARTLEIFQELGLAEKAIQEGQVTTAMNLFYKGKQKAAVNLAGLGEGLSPFPFALSLEQSKTERLLVDFLSANQKEVEWKTEFERVEQDDKGVTVYYRDSRGQEQKIDADYLVGCDGASSEVRHQMGATFKGSTKPKLFYVADVILKSPIINKNELFMYMIRKGFVLFFPMEGAGHYRIVGILPEAKNTDTTYTFDAVAQTIQQQIISPVEFEELRWFSSYKVHSRKADTFRNKRCFIAGDAAHIHTPAGGQGMNTGIQDAYNLAWKLAFAIRGEIKEEVVQTYHTERAANAKRLLQTTDRVFDIMAGTSAFWNFIRLKFFSRIISLIATNKWVQKRFFPLLSQTGITYTNSYLTINSFIGKVQAGVRMPYFVFPDGKQIFDYLADPAFKILFFGTDEKPYRSPINSQRIKLVLHSFSDVPAALFGNETNFYILLRPDNHICYIGKEWNKCREMLDKITNS